MSTEHGSKLTCPTCGAAVAAFAVRCPFGHELTNTKNSDAIQGLTAALQDVVRSTSGDASLARQADTIRNWPVPVNKTDLLEFATLAGSNAMVGAGMANVVHDAWRAKALEVIAKGRIALPADDPTLATLQQLEQRLTSDQRTRLAAGAGRKVAKGVIILAIIAALIFGGLLIVVAMM